MLAVVLLALLASVWAEGDPFPSYGHEGGPTLEELKDLLEGKLSYLVSFYVHRFACFNTCEVLKVI